MRQNIAIDSHLVIALACATVSNRIAIFLLGNLNGFFLPRERGQLVSKGDSRLDMTRWP